MLASACIQILKDDAKLQKIATYSVNSILKILPALQRVLKINFLHYREEIISNA